MEFSTNLLPTWLTRLLAVDVPADATIESVELSFRGAVPWLLVVPLVLVVAGIVALYVTERGTIGPVRRTLAIFLRTSLFAMVLLLLAKPVLSLLLKRERPRDVVVLLDNSQSMTLVDRRLSDADKLRVAIAKGLVPPATRIDLDADPLVLKQASGGMARADMVRAMLGNSELQLFERVGKHGPLRPYLFGTDIRPPGDDDKAASAGETAAQKAGRQLVGGFRADESGTALAEAIVKVLHGKEGELPAAIVLITDGQDNASKFTFSPQEVLQEAAQECARQGVPLFIYGTGTSEGGNLQLKEVPAPDTLFADDLVTVPLRWRAQGMRRGTIAITLTLGGKQVAYKEVPAASGEDLRDVLRFVVPKGEGGEDNRDLVAKIQLKGDDRFKDVVSRSLRVIDQKIKIFYIENAPRWEYKFLQPALIRDRRVQADFLLLHADPKVAKGGPPFLPEFPRSREEFFGAKYNLIILGDVPAESLGKEHQAWIREFVQEGGGLIAIAGRQHMPGDYATQRFGGPATENEAPLADVLPVEFDKQKFGIDVDTRTQEYPATLTEEGQRTQMLMLADTPEESLELWQKQLPGLHWFYPVRKLRPAAVPLIVNPRAKLGDDPMPIMAMHFYGKGQAIFMGSDETWRWRWNHQDKYFVRFWGQIIYQLGLPSLLGDNARRVQVALERSQATLGSKGSVFVRLLNKGHTPRTDAQVEATLDYLDARDAKDRTRKVMLYSVGKDRPGEYAALLVHDRPGRYELKVNNPEPYTYSFRVELPPHHELEDVGMAEKALREMAQTSGGRFYREEDLWRLPGDITPRTVSYRDRADVMLYPLGLALFVLVITGEWLLRKFANLS
jgi:uncharacterized membrane protein